MSSNRKPVFDLVRRLLGRAFTKAEVAAIDAELALLETRGPVDAPSEPEDAHVPGRIGIEGEELIKSFESYATALPDGGCEAYWDDAGKVWTIAWGLTGPDIKQGTRWTLEQAQHRFEAAMRAYSRQVADALGPALPATSQAQFDALVSFHYNTGAIASATLTRKHAAGDFAGAEREFARWVNAGGRRLKGLVRRRAAEAALYRSGS